MAINWDLIGQASQNLFTAQQHKADLMFQAQQNDASRAAQIAQTQLQTQSAARNTDVMASVQREGQAITQQANLFNQKMKQYDVATKVFGSVVANPNADSYKAALGQLTSMGIDVSGAPKEFGKDAMAFINAKGMESGQLAQMFTMQNQAAQLDLQRLQLQNNIAYKQQSLQLHRDQLNQTTKYQEGMLGVEQQKADVEAKKVDALFGNNGFLTGHGSLPEGSVVNIAGANIPISANRIPPNMTKEGYTDLIKQENKQMADLHTEASDAQDILSKASYAESLISNYSGVQGLGGEVALQLNRVLGLFSSEAEAKASQGQAIKSATVTAALNKRVAEKMVGSLSNTDMAMLLGSVVSLTATKEANLLNLANTKAAATSMIAKDAAATAYRQVHGSLAGFSTAFKTYMELNPIARVENGKVVMKPVDPADAAKFVATFDPSKQYAKAKDAATMDDVNRTLGKTPNINEVAKSKGYNNPDDVNAAIAKYGKDAVMKFLGQ